MTSIIKFPPPTDLRSRIIQAASDLIMAKGYSQFTMAELAESLGISKKTLYVHFLTKQALATEVIDTVANGIRSTAETILERTDLSYPEKLTHLISGIADRFSKVSPAVLRDIQRHEPEIYRRIEAVRGKAVPFIFSRILEEGREAGVVRGDVNFAVATEYHLQALLGLLRPETLAKLDLGPAEAAEQALRIFFHGMLVTAPAEKPRIR